MCAIRSTHMACEVAFSVPAAPASVRLARTMFKAVLNSWGSTVDEDMATLLLSELVTNALVHGVRASDFAPRIGVEIVEMADGLHVEVHDPGMSASGGVLVREGSGGQNEGGRGLTLVNALASSWGERTTATGKCVYFDLTAA